ncbi:MAG: hypothetical protein QXO14_04790 [Desulfurococcaceae archaeon]
MFRVRYSILINYLSYLLHLALSTIFTIIVARKLSVTMFGLWATIVGVDTIISSMVYIWAWMNTRLYVRGVREYIRTSFTLTTIYMFLSPIFMTIIGLAYSSILGWGLEYFVLAGLSVVFNSLYVFLSNTVIGVQPYYLGYGNLLRDSVKVLASYITVYLLNMDLIGTILSVIASLLTVDVFFLVIVIRNRFPLGFSLEYFGRILRNAYIPLITLAYGIVASLEKPLATGIARATEITAYLNVASLPRNVIVLAGSSIGVSIMPRLLSEPSTGDIEDYLSIGILLNNWVFVSLIVFSTPILSLYNPIYLNAITIYLLYCIDSIILAYAYMISTIPVGVEKRDLYEEGNALVKTPLFKIPMYNLIRSVIAISIGSIGLYIALLNRVLGVEALILYPIGWLLADVSFLIYSYRLAIKTVFFKFPWREVLCVFLASIASALLAIALGGNRVVLDKLSEDIVRVIPPALIHTVTYVLVSTILSRKYRKLLFTVLKSIK